VGSSWLWLKDLLWNGQILQATQQQQWQQHHHVMAFTVSTNSKKGMQMIARATRAFQLFRQWARLESGCAVVCMHRAYTDIAGHTRTTSWT
jgi:hypothetical protein